MAQLLDRRAVLGAALGVATQFALAAPSTAAGRGGTVATQSLGDGLFVIGGVGTNVLALTAAEGVLLVDTGEARSHRALRSELRRLPGRGEVRTIINTHWHREQTGGNEPFGQAGSSIIAHQKTRQRVSADLWQPESGSYLKALPRAGWPSRAFLQTDSLEFAGQPIECGYLVEAHTDGDVYAWFPRSNVLAVGDVLAAAGRDPELDWFGGGWLGGRVDALEALLKLANDTTRIVPAHGPVVSRRELQAEHDMLAPLFDRLAELVRKGFTTDDMVASKVLGTTGREWHDGARFLYAAHKGLWAHHNTLSHDIV